MGWKITSFLCDIFNFLLSDDEASKTKINIQENKLKIVKIHKFTIVSIHISWVSLSILVISVVVVMIPFLVISVSSFVFLSLCCHSQFQFLSTKSQFSIQLNCQIQIFLSQTFHECKSFLSLFIFDLKIDKSYSLFME